MFAPADYESTMHGCHLAAQDM